eukprot:TRINITY_DN12599_c0_g1_i1.p1 TRINITY_DN12599_c0_g1~~TRINITY_DN12599_c0_g1_i1.p1  ORF type:complete len:125 (+),score=10.55 TRINITY_DN12599_c0_g1_i1:369-743(+)
MSVISLFLHTQLSSYRLFGTISLLGNQLRANLLCWRVTVALGRIMMIFPPSPIVHSPSPPPMLLYHFIKIIMAIHGRVIRLIIRSARAGGPPGHHPYKGGSTSMWTRLEEAACERRVPMVSQLW